MKDRRGSNIDWTHTVGLVTCESHRPCNLLTYFNHVTYVKQASWVTHQVNDTPVGLGHNGLKATSRQLLGILEMETKEGTFLASVYSTFQRLLKKGTFMDPQMKLTNFSLICLMCQCRRSVIPRSL